MRKALKGLLIIALSLVLLTGCSKTVNTQVSNGEQVIMDIKGNEITKAEIYKYLKLRFGPNLITTNLIDMQLEQHVTLDAQDEKEGQRLLEETKELLKEDFEQIIVASGYKDVDDYYNRVILSKLKNEKLFDTYLSENLKEITDGLSSAKVKKIKTNSKPQAEQALAELKEKESVTAEDFVSMANTYSNEEIKGETKVEHVYEERAELKFLNEKLVNAKPGLVDEVIMDGDAFYVIFFEEMDLEADKDVIIASIKENQSVNPIVSQSMFAHYSSLGNFTIHDTDLYDLFKESNPFLVK
ncbi:MAG: peptidylprolyl isomerase [Erysipelothrix sp.]|nr:peptidylprolyl isomerase [Erysipelothrix sp.]